MTETKALPSVHVLFTMNCLPAGSHLAPDGPANWIQSARSIDGFCGTLRSAGFPVTLFLTPQAAAEHAPMLEDFAPLGTELALLVHPPSLPRGKRTNFLGQYPADAQRQLVDVAARAFEDATGVQPRSIRSAMFSASDQTYPLLYELGFRQSSLSNPGRRVNKYGADWVGAEADAHHVSADSRLREGSIPLLELPVTTDASQGHAGIAPDLAVENGTLDEWHRPLIEGQLARLERESVQFRALCFYTSSRRSYFARGESITQTLETLVEYVQALREHYTVVPATLAAAHAAFRQAPARA